MSKSKSKKTKKGSSTYRIQWLKRRVGRAGDGKIETSWESEPTPGIKLYIHYADYMGSGSIHYDYNLYVNRPHILKRDIRFGNHYIGKALTLTAAKLQANKTFLAFFVRILLDSRLKDSPESIGWTGTEWKDIP